MSERVIVIGAGRVGTALATRNPERFELVDRERGWQQLDGEPGTPILLAVRNDDLAAVIKRVPKPRHGDLVFVQNGMLRPWLEVQGLAGATRGLLFMAVPTRGAAIQVGEPGGESPFQGPHAEALAAAFKASELPATVIDEQAFRELELEKLLWNCTFGLFCQAFECNVGAVVEHHRPRLRLLVGELLKVGAPTLDVELELDPLLDRLCAYSLSIPSYIAGVKEWPWRNGWFVKTARARRVRTPTHDMLLLAIGKFF